MANKELPPSLVGKVPDRKSHKNRRTDRLRIELSVLQGEWLARRVAESMKDLDVADPDFHAIYSVYTLLNEQMKRVQKLTANPNPAGTTAKKGSVFDDMG